MPLQGTGIVEQTCSWCFSRGMIGAASTVNLGTSGILSGLASALLVRGGEGGGFEPGPMPASLIPLNVAQESYHLQVLSTYSVVTTLIMNSTLRLYTSTKFPTETTGEETTGKYSMIRLLSNVFVLCTALSIISGAYTAFLFQLMVIYEKSALAMGNEMGYVAFKTATALYRRWGFRCFIASLGSFVGSFLLSLYSNTISTGNKPNPVGKAILWVSVLLTAIGASHIQHILNLATRFIFQPPTV